MKNDIIFSDAEDVLKAVDFKSLDGASIFITGATGLLGTHLLASLCLLKESGLNISVTGQYNSPPADFTYEIAERGGFYLQRDLMGGADVVIHAAGYAQPLRFVNAPATTIRLNTEVTHNLLQRLAPGGRFLFLSSSEVYSGNTKQVVTEDDIGTTTPYHPRACYIEGKRCGEAICNAYRNAGVRAVSARLGATYGPGTRKHDKRVINSLIEQALTTGKIEREFPGHDARSYCYSRDAIKMLWQILLHGKAPVYNVGGVERASVATLAGDIGNITNAVVFPTPKVGSELAGSAKNPILSVSRIDEEFGDLDYLSLSGGLRRTIEWQKGLYQ
jgi:nucleoside-diphosphate-sugar epimerase